MDKDSKMHPRFVRKKDKETISDNASRSKRHHFVPEPASQPPSPHQPSPQFADNMAHLLDGFDALDMRSKTRFLNALISNHIPSELLSPLYLSLVPLLRQDFLTSLPIEIAFRILEHLDIPSLIRCMMVSHAWSSIVLANVSTWKRHLQHEESWSSAIQAQTPASSNPSYACLRRINASRRLKYMWQKGIPKSFSFHCHDRSVITCLLLLDSNRVISASDDGTICIWCLHTGRCLMQLLGHTGGVWALHMLGSYLLSGSTDRTCRLWSLASGECLGILNGHTSTVRCAELFVYSSSSGAIHREILYAVSGSRDHTLRIWDLKRMGEQKILYGHLSSIRCLLVDASRDQVISGSYDCTARIWDLRDGTCLHVLLGHTDRIYSLCLQGHHLATGGLDANVHVWDVRTGECLHILEGHRGLVGSLQFYADDAIISGNTDGTLRIWNLNSGECLVRIRSDNGSTITCLQADRQRLVVGCDKHLRLWDPKTGALIRDLMVGIDTVWRVLFDDAVCVAACQVEGLTAIYVFRFDGV